jgi:hypothetical protein
MILNFSVIVSEPQISETQTASRYNGCVSKNMEQVKSKIAMSDGFYADLLV